MKQTILFVKFFRFKFVMDYFSLKTYNVKTRTCAVTIFKSLLSAINEHMPSKEEKAKLLNPVLPVFIKKLVSSLGNPSGQCSFAMKTEIIKGIVFILS